MAWPSVGSVEFITLDGSIEPKGEKTEIIRRPGVNGLGVKKLGTSGDSFQLACVKDVNCANAAARKVKIEECMALKGSVVTMVDDYGMTWPEMLVQVVARPKMRALKTAVGGIEGTNATDLLTTTMVLIDTGN